MWHRYKFLDRQEISGANFELQGVLIRPDAAPDRLTVLPKGRMEPTQLEALMPFRSLANCSILAEYQVGIPHHWAETEEGRLQSATGQHWFGWRWK